MGPCLSQHNQHRDVISNSRDQKTSINSSRHKFQQPCYTQITTNIVHQQSNIFQTYSLLKNSGSAINLDESLLLLQHNLTGRIRQAKLIEWDGQHLPDYLERYLGVSLNHPHLVTTFEIYTDQKHIYLVQEYCSGQLLGSYVANRGTIQEVRIQSIMRQIIEAMNYLHQKQLVYGQLTINSFQFQDDSHNFQLKLINPQMIFMKLEVTNESAVYASPELLNTKEYTYASEIWACGVICYYLMCGVPPFQVKETLAKTKRQIIRGGLCFDSFKFEKVSNEGRLFLQQLLAFKSTQRYTSQQCLNLEWVSQHKMILQRNKETLLRMRNMRKVTQLQACVMLFMINQYCSQQQYTFLTTFEEFDTNKDQKISQHELLDAYQKTFGPAEAQAQVNMIFNSLDSDHNGYMEFEEFILATADKQAIITHERLEETFKVIDQDKNGQIGVAEIASTFSLDNALVKKLLKVVDEDQNGSLSLIEFKHLMFKLL